MQAIYSLPFAVHDLSGFLFHKEFKGEGGSLLH